MRQTPSQSPEDWSNLPDTPMSYQVPLPFQPHLQENKEVFHYFNHEILFITIFLYSFIILSLAWKWQTKENFKTPLRETKENLKTQHRNQPGQTDRRQFGNPPLGFTSPELSASTPFTTSYWSIADSWTHSSFSWGAQRGAWMIITIATTSMATQPSLK